MAPADLSITKMASAGTVMVGATLTYTVEATNHGPSDANSTIIIDSLPLDVTMESISASQGTGCAPIGNNEYLCSLGTLANDATATVTIVVKPTVPGSITNTASVSSGTTEVDPNNNTASVRTLVRRAEADLVVSKTHTPEQADLCTPVTYTIVVTNNGPAPATGVVLVDQLPASVKVLSAYPSQGRCCSQYLNEVTCQIGALAVGASATVNITIIPHQIGTITNTAIVTANEDDLDTSNNQAIDTLKVVPFFEQVDYLITRVNALVTSGLLTQQQADSLLVHLENAKELILNIIWPFLLGWLLGLKEAKHCLHDSSINDAISSLLNFSRTLNGYINQELIPRDVGYPIIGITESIMKKLIFVQTCPKQGDEHSEP